MIGFVLLQVAYSVGYEVDATVLDQPYLVEGNQGISTTDQKGKQLNVILQQANYTHVFSAPPPPPPPPPHTHTHTTSAVALVLPCRNPGLTEVFINFNVSSLLGGTLYRKDFNFYFYRNCTPASTYRQSVVQVCACIALSRH